MALDWLELREQVSRFGQFPEGNVVRANREFFPQGEDCGVLMGLCNCALPPLEGLRHRTVAGYLLRR